MVMKKLSAHGIEVGRGKEKDAKKLKELLSNLTMPSGVPIKKVRILKNEKTIRPIRSGASTSYVKPGSTHHLCIFEWEEKGKRKRDAIFVSMLEATYRLHTKQPVIQFSPPDNDVVIPAYAQFVCSLSSREAFLAEVEGRKVILMFNSAPSTTKQLRFYGNTDARKSGKRTMFRFSVNTLTGRKVTIDLLGRVRWAND
jgi:CRISPR-associated endonuclease Csn1